MEVDKEKWSGEGEFTQLLVEKLRELGTITLARVEDAPASRSEADYNFMSNEVFVAFATREQPLSEPPAPADQRVLYGSGSPS